MAVEREGSRAEKSFFKYTDENLGVDVEISEDESSTETLFSTTERKPASRRIFETDVSELDREVYAYLVLFILIHI